MVILNDPFKGGTHLPDITMVALVFAGRERPCLDVKLLKTDRTMTMERSGAPRKKKSPEVTDSSQPGKNRRSGLASMLPKSYNYRYVICALIFSGYVLVFFQRLCPAVLALDIQAAYGVGGTLLGVLGSAYFYPYALMQLPAGLLVDRYGPRYTVSFFFVIAALGALLMSQTNSLNTAVFGRVLVGLGVSTLFVSNFKLIAEWFAPRQFVVMGGLFMAMGGVGALLASPAGLDKQPDWLAHDPGRRRGDDTRDGRLDLCLCAQSSVGYGSSADSNVSGVGIRS